MRRNWDGARKSRRESGSVIVLILVVLAVIGGGWWYLQQHRADREKEARAFAQEASRRIVLQQDLRFLDFTLSPQAKVQYPPSWRIRLMDWVREPGVPKPDFQMKGDVVFASQFLEPSGHFVSTFEFPTGPAYFEIQVSHPGALWVIDAINWTWTPPPTPTPSPTPSPSPTPTPSPAKHRRS